MQEFIRHIPKTDLHVHLDGSLRVETLIELAKEHGVMLPSETVDGLNEILFKERYECLEDYLEGFKYMTAVMQTPEAIERIAYEFAWDNFNEGVRYFEVRFAPQLHINENQSVEDVLTATYRGLKRATDEFNRAREDKTEPEANFGIIACAMRAIFPGMSAYYDSLLNVHRFSRPKRIYSLASIELIQSMVHLRNEHGLPIVGLDIAGPEEGYPPDDHNDAFDIAHRNFFKKTVHAGEAYGPESIFKAITRLHADRIGHGYYLFSEDKITDPAITDPHRYVTNLAEYIADRRITIEVCLTSNLQTNPEIRELVNHTFQRMMEAQLSVTLCTDNRTVSKTTVSREIEIAVNTFNLGNDELRNLILYGFKRSFYPGRYCEKRRYVRQVINHYEKIAEKYCAREGI
jgi:adenosine deaminase